MVRVPGGDARPVGDAVRRGRAVGLGAARSSACVPSAPGGRACALRRPEAAVRALRGSASPPRSWYPARRGPETMAMIFDIRCARPAIPVGCHAPARATTRRGTTCPGSDGKEEATTQERPRAHRARQQPTEALPLRLSRSSRRTPAEHADPTCDSRTQAARNKRRRGSRGGRGRKRPGAADAARTARHAVAEQPRETERDKPERASAPSGQPTGARSSAAGARSAGGSRRGGHRCPPRSASC